MTFKILIEVTLQLIITLHMIFQSDQHVLAERFVIYAAFFSQHSAQVPMFFHYALPPAEVKNKAPLLRIKPQHF